MTPAPSDAQALVDVIADGVHAVYQPIVELGARSVIGYEALARGPAGSELERPDALFGAARRHGLVQELDWACKTAAVSGALAGRLTPPLCLFVNSEPEAAGALMPPAFVTSWAAAKLSYMELFFEITERAVAARPAELLRSVRYLRSLGWGIALDDVGADPQSLALLPFIRPDVVKLDMRAVQSPDPGVIDVLMAVTAEVERSGAVVLAEGIETEEHLATAVMYGAQLGQGWLFGRPGPLPADQPLPPAAPLKVRSAPEPAGATPFAVLEGHVPVRRATASHLLQVSRALEGRARRLPYPPVLLVSFQTETRFEPQREAYAQLAAELPFVGVFGIDMPAEPAPGVRGIALAPDDELRLEWALAVVSPYLGFLLAARDRGPRDDQHTQGEDRPYDYLLTFDRDRVIDAASVLLGRIASGADGQMPIDGLVDFATVMTDALTGARELREAAEELLAALARSIGLQSTFISSVTGGRYEVRHSFDVRTTPRLPAGTNLAWEDAICKHALDVGRSAFSDVQTELPAATVAVDVGFRRFVSCPVVNADGRVIGTLCGASDAPGEFSEQELTLVRSFSHLIASRLTELLEPPES